MELAPLSRFLLRIRSAALCLYLSQVFLSHHALAVSLVLRFGGTFPLLLIHISKVSLFLFEFLLNFGHLLAWCRGYGTDSSAHAYLDLFVVAS